MLNFMDAIYQDKTVIDRFPDSDFDTIYETYPRLQETNKIWNELFDESAPIDLSVIPPGELIINNNYIDKEEEIIDSKAKPDVKEADITEVIDTTESEHSKKNGTFKRKLETLSQAKDEPNKRLLNNIYDRDNLHIFGKQVSLVMSTYAITQKQVSLEAELRYIFIILIIEVI